MNIVDATPPADFPDLVIFMDTDKGFNERNPGKGFYLRIRLDGNNVDIVNFEDCYTLPHARQLARAKGYEPTHWMRTSDAVPTRFY